MDRGKTAQMMRAWHKSGSGTWRLMPAGVETGELDVINVQDCLQVAINSQCTGLYFMTNVPHPDNPDEDSVYLLEFERDAYEATGSRDLVDVLKVRMVAPSRRRTTAALAAAANLRLDAAFKRLGALERQGAVTSKIVHDGEVQEMAWSLCLAAVALTRKDVQEGQTP